MVLKRPDMSSCSQKCKCGADTLNPGAVYDCNNPCGRVAPFNAANCDCGIGMGFASLGVRWQLKIYSFQNGVLTGPPSFARSDWYNGYLSWGRGDYRNQNRYFVQYFYSNTVRCIVDQGEPRSSRGAFDIYYLTEIRGDDGELSYNGDGGSYWPNYFNLYIL